MKSFIHTYFANNRIEDTLSHLAVYDIHPEVIEVKQGSSPYLNTLKTVQSIINQNYNENNLLIMEDDVRLYCGFDPDDLALKAQGKFGLLCTGSFSVGDIRKSELDDMVFCSYYYGAQAVIYNKCIYEALLSYRMEYIDTLSRFFTNTAITLPFFSYQKDYSDPNKDGDRIFRESLFKKEEQRLMMSLNK